MRLSLNSIYTHALVNRRNPILRYCFGFHIFLLYPADSGWPSS